MKCRLAAECGPKPQFFPVTSAISALIGTQSQSVELPSGTCGLVAAAFARVEERLTVHRPAPAGRERFHPLCPAPSLVVGSRPSLLRWLRWSSRCSALVQTCCNTLDRTELNRIESNYIKSKQIQFNQLESKPNALGILLHCCCVHANLCFRMLLFQLVLSGDFKIQPNQLQHFEFMNVINHVLISYLLKIPK